MGVHMEGNMFLRSLMISYGMAPALFVVKLVALFVAIVLALHSHRRRWMRPVLIGIVAFYVILAVVPWTVLITKEFMPADNTSTESPNANIFSNYPGIIESKNLQVVAGQR